MNFKIHFQELFLKITWLKKIQKQVHEIILSSERYADNKRMQKEVKIK